MSTLAGNGWGGGDADAGVPVVYNKQFRFLDDFRESFIV